MQKTITVFVLKSGDVEKLFNSRKQAEKAQTFLKEFGVEAEIVQVKKTIEL